MNKFSLAFLLVLCPLAALGADGGSISFAPPPSDVSVVFLGNIFGIVDGVLHGTGSQIMGAMFGVFNAAVLALGGMIIMYTLLVSTMNTAHEGQMLGQKWSSMWIPIRSTVGLALLIPKASGYCLMQIFVMWIVVQGVGAADKIWDAALEYLNRGGVIIQEQVDPTNSIMNAQSVPNGQVANGAQSILAGQVCMLSLQRQLESRREVYLTQKEKGGGLCANPTSDMKPFCDTPVPDFISTVDIVGTQSAKKNQTSPFSVPMPNLDTPPYSQLNGICGTISWNPYSFTDSGSSEAEVRGISSIKTSDIDTAKMSRAIAIQQVFMDLSTVAQIIINNDPGFAGPPKDSAAKNFSSIAVQQFGVPTTAQGSVCTEGSPDCILWGQTSATSTSTGTLFNGTEFPGALADYNGIMLPTLNLARVSKDERNANASREFIKDASTKGWIMAGSYFFYIVNLNAKNSGGADLTDNNNGLDKSCMDTSKLTQPFTKGDNAGGATSACGTQQSYPILATWLNHDITTVNPIVALISGGSGTDVPSVVSPDLSKGGSLRSVISSTASSTVYGYTNNSTLLTLPGQPGQKPLQFANMLNMKIDPSSHYLPNASFDCGRVQIVVFSFCLGQMMGNLIYNSIFRVVYNFFLNLFGQFINQVLNAFLMIPLQGMAFIFQDGLKILNQPNVNPIVALANMGTYYINFTGQVWLMLIQMSILAVLIPVFGIFIFALISLALPLLVAWMGTMLMIGMTTAYYVPVLPYMIFTFGSIAWLISVIEAMVAAPIVALGVTHPEGHEAFGKGEYAIMILMNVFLRPALMIIGYIAAISLSYVGVWIMNAGFDTAIGFIQGSSDFGTQTTGKNANQWDIDSAIKDAASENTDEYVKDRWNKIGSSIVDPFNPPVNTPAGPVSGGYTGWAGIFAFFFSILIYTTMYLTIVQKAFSLIATLPDKVLRWIGGQPEGVGQEAASWSDEAKNQVSQAGKESKDARGAVDKQVSGYADKGIGWAKGKFQGSSSGGGVEGKGSSGPNSTPEGGGGGGTPPPEIPIV